MSLMKIRTTGNRKTGQVCLFASDLNLLWLATIIAAFLPGSPEEVREGVSGIALWATVDGVFVTVPNRSYQA